jgi:hypothetical protein
VAGWNLIGLFEATIDSAALVTTPSNLVETGYFSFQSGYRRTRTLQPGLGYWVRARSAGTLTFPPAGRVVRVNKEK